MDLRRIMPPMLATPSLASFDYLPASPTWVRAWAASHTRAVGYTLAQLRATVAAMPPRTVDLMRRYPNDSIVRCLCGAKRCQGFAIVCGVAVMGEDAPRLLVRSGPHGNPYMMGGEVDLEILHYGGEVTPARFDVLARLPLGVC